MIADDNLDFCKLLGIAINSQPDMRVISTLHRADSIFEEVERLSPHILIVDLSMPGKQPLTAIQETSQKFSSTQIIAFSAHDDQETIDKVLTSGAVRYISKMQGLQSILSGIRLVADIQTN